MSISSKKEDSLLECDESYTFSDKKITSLTYEDAIQIMRMIDDNNVDSLKKIAEKYGENFITKPLFNGRYNPIFYAIYNQKIASLAFLIKLCGPEKFLDHTDPNSNLNPIFFAVYFEKTETLKLIIDACGNENFFTQSYGALHLDPVFFSLFYQKLKSIQEFIEIYQNDFLRLGTQTSPYNPILYSIKECKPMSFFTITEMLNDGVLSKICDSDNDSIIWFAVKEYFKFDETDDLKPQQKEILKFIVNKIFGEDNEIEDKISKLEKFYYSFSYLRLGFSFDEFYEYTSLFLKSKKYLENLLPADKSFEFKEVSELIYDNIVNCTPIEVMSDTKTQNLLIYHANLADHVSFFIFHINPQTKCFEAISYIDGNGILQSEESENVDDKIFGVTKFILDNPVHFEKDEDVSKIIDDFISKNSLKKSYHQLNEEFNDGKVEFCSQKLTECSKRQGFIKTTKQFRGNCVYKADKILLKYIFQSLNPDLSFDPEGSSQTKSGAELFKKYKKAMKDVALQNIENLSRELNSQDEFDNFLLIEKSKLLYALEKKMEDKEAKQNLRLLARVALLDDLSTQSLKRPSSLISSESLADKPDVLLTVASSEQLREEIVKKSKN